MPVPARLIAVFVLALAAVSAAAPARADNGPVIVIPRHPGVPTVINGRNANWAVVEGDWGLSRPGHMAPIVYGGKPLEDGRVVPKQGVYHPRYGTKPDRGRHEIEPSPDREMPPQAENFSRNWSTSSDVAPQREYHSEQRKPEPFYPGADPVPPTLDPQPQPFNPPIVVVPGRRRP